MCTTLYPEAGELKYIAQTHLIIPELFIMLCSQFLLPPENVNPSAITSPLSSETNACVLESLDSRKTSRSF